MPQVAYEILKAIRELNQVVCSRDFKENKDCKAGKG